MDQPQLIFYSTGQFVLFHGGHCGKRDEGVGLAGLALPPVLHW